MRTAAAVDLDPVAEEQLTQVPARRFASLVGRERITRWAFAVGSLAAGIALVVLAPHGRSASLLVYVLLVGAFAVASRIVFRVGPGYTIPTELILVPMLFLLPPAQVPLLVTLAVVLGQTPDYVRGKIPVVRAAVTTVGNASYALGPALVMLAFGSPAPRLREWGVVALALLAQYGTDFATSTVREWCALRIPMRQLVKPLAWVFMIDALLAPIGLMTAVAAQSTRAALLLELPLLALIWTFAREHSSRLDHAIELSNAYRGTAFVLADVIDADDAYTGTHSREVLELVLAVCDELELDPRPRRKAEFAALLHDVGKIRIPHEILNKPGPLSADERAIMNTHTIEGERLLVKVGGLLGEVGAIVRATHERFDGGGYPDGLAGDEIPLIARIVTCCDAFNAMTTDRPHRRAWSVASACDELRANRGTQFDPDVVDSVIRVLSRAGLPVDVEPVSSTVADPV